MSSFHVCDVNPRNKSMRILTSVYFLKFQRIHNPDENLKPSFFLGAVLKISASVTYRFVLEDSGRFSPFHHHLQYMVPGLQSHYVPQVYSLVFLLAPVEIGINCPAQLSVKINVSLSTILHPVSHERNACTVKFQCEFIPCLTAELRLWHLVFLLPRNYLVSLPVAFHLPVPRIQKSKPGDRKPHPEKKPPAAAPVVAVFLS